MAEKLELLNQLADASDDSSSDSGTQDSSGSTDGDSTGDNTDSGGLLGTLAAALGEFATAVAGALGSLLSAGDSDASAADSSGLDNPDAKGDPDNPDAKQEPTLWQTICHSFNEQLQNLLDTPGLLYDDARDFLSNALNNIKDTLTDLLPAVGGGLAPSQSPVWNGYDSTGREGIKTSGSGNDKQYYEWDRTHGDIETYDRNGKHIGVTDPITGDLDRTKSIPGRSIKKRL